MVEIALALGIAVNLIFTEVFGLASGGLVVPGYLALASRSARPAALDVPGRDGHLVHGPPRVHAGGVLYGRRRFGVTMLTGFVAQGLYSAWLGSWPSLPADLRAVGYLVPGLIAHAAISQGVWPTIAMTTAGAIVVRLCLAALSWVLR